jgi:hypothetical protein
VNQPIDLEYRERSEPDPAGSDPVSDPFDLRQSSGVEPYRLEDFFTIKRGVETGDNGFFILGGARVRELDLPLEFLRPILPGPHQLPEGEIVADPEGYPILEERLFLLDAPMPEEEIRQRYPSLYRYLQSGLERGVHQRYSCRHRNPWYAQERRPPAPYLCAYMGQSWEEDEEVPYRFILNHSRAIAPNIYLMMYPGQPLARLLADSYPAQVALWDGLNDIGVAQLAARDSVYGDLSGRLEPNELGSVPADPVVALFPDLIPDPAAQMRLFDLPPAGES